ncbi:MAG TPA: hypothetical protein VHA15_11160 [Burkholderiales bacterium]|nr:hypothetical protein [Burkholderiales bacterium]
MDFVNSMSPFWQGVLASVVAGLLLIIGGYIARIAFSSVREWVANRRGAVAVLRQQLASDQPTVRGEATIQVLFGAAKWFMIAALLYGASSVEIIPWPFGVPLKLLALACLVASLWWVFQYQNPARATPAEWSELLTTYRWVLVFNPPHRLKPITFMPDGTVGEGRNNNEYMWRVSGDKLELVQADGRVHSRFAFNQRTTSFLHTNDADTLSIRGQYIIPASSAANNRLQLTRETRG